MDYLQYEVLAEVERLNGVECFKPYYKWITSIQNKKQLVENKIKF